MDQIIYIILLILFFAETSKLIELAENEYLEKYFVWLPINLFFINNSSLTLSCPDWILT